MRELTRNEKILITVLGIVLIGWGSYHLIITPQSQKLETLKTDKLEYERKIGENHAMILKENDVNEGLYRQAEEKDQLASKYFSNLQQAQITYLLNDLLAEDDLEILDMNINMPDYEEFGENQVKKMDILISYAGDYMGVMEALK